MPIALTLAGCVIASYFDIRARRIPNAVTGSLALAALIVHGLGGLQPLGISLAVMIALVLAGTLVYARGGIGGGDIKLAVAASGMLSYPLCVPFLLYSAIAGGCVALAFLAFRSRAASDSRGITMTFAGGTGSAVTKGETLPYAVAFALGALLIALSQSVAPFLRITL